LKQCKRFLENWYLFVDI